MERQIFTTPESRKKVYQNLFHPKSIAVIGASNNDLKPGGRVIEKIKEHGDEAGSLQGWREQFLKKVGAGWE